MKYFIYVVALFFASPVGSQPNAHWRKIGDFQSYSPYFFDELHGVADAQNRILRTDDGGKRWYEVDLIPSSVLPNHVSDIEFLDTAVGFLSTIGNSSDEPCFWKTTDGGRVWIAEQSYPAFEFSSVSVFMGSCGYVHSSGGTAFSSPLTGLRTAAAGPILISTPWAGTTNGGCSWFDLRSNMPFLENWGLFYQISSGKYFASQDALQQDPTIYSSTDEGHTWQGTYGGILQINPLYTTGHIEGDQTALYVQGELAKKLPRTFGFWRSTDGGAKFKFVGGPWSATDVRFSVPNSCNGGVVVAAGFGDPNNRTTFGLWITTDGGDGELVAVGPPEIRYEPVSASRCAPAALVINFKNIQCRGITLTEESVRELDANGSFTFLPGQLPVYLDSGQAVDLRLQYNAANAPSTHFADLKLHGVQDGIFQNPYDTTFRLQSRSIRDSSSLFSDAKSFLFDTLSTCLSLDTVALFRNLGCEPLIVERVSIFGDDFSAEPKSYPVTLPSSGILSLRLQFHPTSSGRASSYLLVYTLRGTVRDTLRIPLSGFGRSPGILSAEALSFGFVDGCTEKDSAILLRNLDCLERVIDRAELSSGSEFAILGIGPDTIQAGSSSWVTIRFTPTRVGLLQDTLVLSLKDGSTLRIPVSGTGGKGAGVLQMNGALALGTVSICRLDTNRFVLYNTGCGEILLDTLLAERPELTIVSTTKTRIDLGDSAVIRFIYHPQNKGDQSIALTVRVIINGDTVTRRVQISVNITDGDRALSSEGSFLLLRAVNICQSRDTTVTIRNTGCDTVHVSRTSLSGIGYTTPDGIPFVLAPGEVRTIRIHLEPDTLGHPDFHAGELRLTSDAEPELPPININTPLRYPASLGLSLESMPNQTAGDEAVLGMRSTLIPSGITSISYDLIYNGDLLTFERLDGGNASVPTLLPDGRTNLHVTAEAFPGKQLRQFYHFRVALSRDSVTAITITNVRLNDQPSSETNCLAAIEASESSFEYIYNCGDRTISKYLQKGRLAFRVVGINPNPAGSHVSLLLDRTLELPIRYELIDLLGITKQSGSIESNETDFDLTSLVAGTYFLRLSAAGQVVTETIRHRR